MSNTMGAHQGNFSVTNNTVTGGVYAIAIGIPSGVNVIGSHDGVQKDWEAQLVTRAQWNAGFSFPGSGGVWAPPDTTVKTFDSFFDITYNVAAVFWVATTAPGVPIALGAINGNFYLGPEQSGGPALSASDPYVAFGNGVTAWTGPARLRRVDQFGFQHDAIAMASMSVAADNTFTVANIGSSGQDGVMIDLGEVDGVTLAGMALASGAFGAGESVTTELLGVSGGLAGQPLESLRLARAPTPIGPGVLVSADFPGVAPAGVSVEMFDSSGASIASYVSPIPADFFLTQNNVPAGPTRMESSTAGSLIEYWTGGAISVVDSSTGITYPNVAMIRATASSPSAAAPPATNVRIIGRNVPALQLTGEGIIKRKIVATEVGAFTYLAGTPGGITVSNIGSSGLDGVSMDLGSAESFNATWNPLQVCGGGGLPPGVCTSANASLEFRAFGSAGGAPGMFLGSMRITPAPTGLTDVQISADYTSVGSTTQRIEIWSAGSLVTVISGHAMGMAATTTGWPTGCGKGGVTIGGVRTACYRATWPASVNFSITGGPTVAGDEIRVLAENPASTFDYLERFDILAGEIYTVDITSLQTTPFPPCISDISGDGSVGASDLAALIGFWGTSNPAADLDGDGVVGSADLAMLIGSWGPCP